MFPFNNSSQEISTYFTQEMLNLGFLAKEAIAITYVYNDRIINKYQIKLLLATTNVIYKIYQFSFYFQKG